jgi:hypothetical protein
MVIGGWPLYCTGKAESSGQRSSAGRLRLATVAREMVINIEPLPEDTLNWECVDRCDSSEVSTAGDELCAKLRR